MSYGYQMTSQTSSFKTPTCKNGHGINLSNQRYNARCDVCGSQQIQSSYCCLLCDFDVCLNCSMKLYGLGSNVNMNVNVNINSNMYQNTLCCLKGHSLAWTEHTTRN